MRCFGLPGVFTGPSSDLRMTEGGVGNLRKEARMFLCMSSTHLAEEKITHTGQVTIVQSLDEIVIMPIILLEMGR